MFELAWPWALLLLPLPVLVWFFFKAVEPRFGGAVILPFYTELTSQLQEKKQHSGFNVSVISLFLVWIFLVIAFAGPRYLGAWMPVVREGHHIMMVMDISPSMEARDMLFHKQVTSRLFVVKQAARQFINHRLNDKIGLILFGAKAYLQTPLTYDLSNVLMRLEDSTVGLAGKSTSIGDALGLAVKRLQDVPKKGRIIVLLTDGVNNSGILTPEKAALLAEEEKIKIYTIGLGAEAPVNSFQGLFFSMGTTTAELDEETLKSVAERTGGRYFRATDGKSLQEIYQTIDQLETTHQEDRPLRPEEEYYPWFLGFASGIFLLWLVHETGLFFDMSDLRRKLRQLLRWFRGRFFASGQISS